MTSFKSSAVLIALVSGSILTGLIAVTALSNQALLKKAYQSKYSEVAESAAMSGIEEGMGRYLKYEETGKAEDLFAKDPIKREVKLKSDKAYYILNIKIDSLSFGNDFSKTDWFLDSGIGVEQKALPLKAGDDLRINLDYLSNYSDSKKPTKFELRASNLFKLDESNLKLSQSYNPELQMTLIENGTQKIVESRKLKINQDHSAEFNSLEKCTISNRSCSIELNLVSGSDQLVLLKTRAFSNTQEIKPTGDKPGTIVIESTGIYHNVKKVLQAKYSPINGNYLGIFYPVVK